MSTQDDQFIQGGSQMALVHNMLIHSFNSIYLQAPVVKPVDVPDFVQYCNAWYKTLDGHHENEEDFLFPMIEEACGVKGIMGDEVEEHSSRHLS